MATATASKSDQTIVEFDVRTDEMLVNMGPQHPSTHGVLRLVLRTDGEIVSEVVPHLGYLHRCAEKIGENVLPIQYIPYTDRMDYLAGMNMNLGLTFPRIQWPISRPTSLLYFFSSCVSSRKRIPTVTPHVSITAHTRLGRRYGNLSKIVPRWNNLG